jgi:mRNA interferase HigB
MILNGWKVLETLVARETATGAPMAGALASRAASFRRATEAANWKNPAEVRGEFGRTDFVGKTAIFDLCGNNYRLIAKIDYRFGIVDIRFAGSHAEYDRIDVAKF